MDLQAWFEGLSAANVERMKGEAEGPQLDCKAIGAENDMKRNLATVISGFANADGGVCLWGVNARKDSSGVDCIEGFPGVPNSRLVASRLDELSAMATSPGARGVLHRALVKRNGQGFVATFVPASSSGPHMARYGEDRYYQRIGQSFLRMEHFQIADMFGRRARPVLEVSTNSDPGSPYSLGLSIRNVGRGPARAPFIELTVSAPFHRNQYGIDGNRNELLAWSKSNRAGWWLHSGGADFVIHPTMSVLLGGVWLGHGPFPEGLPAQCEIQYKVGALDIDPTEGTLKVQFR